MSEKWYFSDILIIFLLIREVAHLFIGLLEIVIFWSFFYWVVKFFLILKSSGLKLTRNVAFSSNNVITVSFSLRCICLLRAYGRRHPILSGTAPVA